MSNIFDFIAKLEELIQRSPKPKIGGENRRVIDYNELLDILGDIKVSIPEEIRRAQAVLMEEKSIIREAHDRASMTISDARIQSERMISDEYIIKESNRRGDEIIERAEKKADLILQGARTYTDEMLLDVQQYLQESIRIIETNRNELNEKHGKPVIAEDPLAAFDEEAVEELAEEESTKEEKPTEEDEFAQFDAAAVDAEELRRGVEIDMGSDFLMDDGFDIDFFSNDLDEKE